MANRLFNTARFSLEKRIIDIFGDVSFASGVASLVADKCHGIASIASHIAGVKASGTLTLLNVVATDTCEVGGVTFIADASTQDATHFVVGASDADTAANLVTAIHANPTTAALVTAANGGTAVVTVTAIAFGTGGNAITLVGSANITASGAGTLASGAFTAGLFAITLDKSMHRLLSVSRRFVLATGAPAAPVMQVVSFVPGNQPVLTVQFTNASGTATDPADAETLLLDIEGTDTAAV